MIPAFKITVEDEDITTTISQRLIGIEVQDSAGYESDSVSITLDDTDTRIALPSHGAVLKVWLGYSGGLKEFGEYQVDEVEVTGPPHSIRITGRSADFREKLKSPRSRSWHDITLGALVQAVAAEHNMVPRISERFMSVPLKHIDQLNESDMNLLYRLSIQYDATVKQIGERLLFIGKAHTKTASGEPLPIINLHKEDLSKWSATMADRSVYQSVIASYTDIAGGNLAEVQAGEGLPQYRLRNTHQNHDEAMEAAVGKLDRLQRTGRNLRVDLPGRPDLIAESPVMVSGIRSGVDGEWVAERVSHVINKQGYRTSVDLIPPSRTMN